MARSALFESAGRWTEPPRRSRAFGAMARSSGPRASFDDGRDLATCWSLSWALCVLLCALCVSVVLRVMDFAFFASLRFKINRRVKPHTCPAPQAR